MKRHTSWHLWLISVSNICVTLILVSAQYWSVLSTHCHDGTLVVLFELMLQRVYITFSHIKAIQSYWTPISGLQRFNFAYSLLLLLFALKQRNYSFAKNVLTIERIHYCHHILFHDVVKTARMIHEKKQRRAKLTTPLCSKAKDTHNTEQFQFIK